jgi:hypothetical protein
MTGHLSWETLNDLVDGHVSDAQRASAESHAGRCATCADRLASLRASVEAARELPSSAPAPDDLWGDIRRTIEAGKVARLDTPGGAGPRGWWVTPARVIAAAVVLVALSSVLTTAILRSRATPMVAAGDEAGALAVAWQVAERGYQSSVLELRAQLAAQADRLAPATIATIEHSLSTIDVAIAEAREALLRDPSNATLPELLASNYRQKIDLLRRATQLASST